MYINLAFQSFQQFNRYATCLRLSGCARRRRAARLCASCSRRSSRARRQRTRGDRDRLRAVRCCRARLNSSAFAPCAVYRWLGNEIDGLPVLAVALVRAEADCKHLLHGPHVLVALGSTARGSTVIRKANIRCIAWCTGKTGPARYLRPNIRGSLVLPLGGG